MSAPRLPGLSLRRGAVNLDLFDEGRLVAADLLSYEEIEDVAYDYMVRMGVPAHQAGPAARKAIRGLAMSLEAATRRTP